MDIRQMCPCTQLATHGYSRRNQGNVGGFTNLRGQIYVFSSSLYLHITLTTTNIQLPSGASNGDGGQQHHWPAVHRRDELHSGNIRVLDTNQRAYISDSQDLFPDSTGRKLGEPQRRPRYGCEKRKFALAEKRILVVQTVGTTYTYRTVAGSLE